MQAPIPQSVALHVDRTRCSCQVETLVVSPRAWYEGQRMVGIEPPCLGCGKSLLEQRVPEGAKTESYVLAEVPTDLAAAIGTELVDEVTACRNEKVAEPPGGLTAERWTVPHEASPEYETWLAERPPPPPLVSRQELWEWGISTAAVALWVAFCVII